MHSKVISIAALILTLSLSPIIFADIQSITNQSNEPAWISQLSTKLSFTPQQKVGLKAIRFNLMNELLTMKRRLQKIDTQLAELAKHDPLDSSKIDDLIYQKKELLGRMVRSKVNFDHAIYTMLNPEQKVKFDGMVAQNIPNQLQNAKFLTTENCH